ncbi:tail fiber protein [Escherichia phage herni]|uniref:Putative tail tip protein n=1 Tax=Escherichia phage herni TaxID=2696404 RepID=A0A6B9XCA1_9CAUD|nr:tail fiber protein [Escherichia phage herni]QHR74736.1 putative tail tip protein [Escherichia phage herni]
MAIYRTGQASMDAQGYITGYETKWREQLTLIRPGATIFFIDAPFQAAVISEVISDTQIRAITTGGAEIGRSNYIILLHDSITVDGLAQDVAETLRYYQSKETQIEEAIEFFKTFDWEAFKAMVDQVAENAAKTSETNASNSASEALVSKNAAKASEDAAKLSETKSKTSEVNAKQSEINAEQWAQSVNPDNLLTKSGNLVGITDKSAARSNLGLGSVATENTVPIEKGGTAATTAAAARTNLGVGDNNNVKHASLRLDGGESLVFNDVERNGLILSNASFGIDSWVGQTIHKWYTDWTRSGLVRGRDTHLSDYRVHVWKDGFTEALFRFLPDQRLISGNSVNPSVNEFQKAPLSDRDLKKEIQYTDGEESYNRVRQWRPAMFKYKDSDVQRYGLIAQDLVSIDQEYVHLLPGYAIYEDVMGVDEEGNEVVVERKEVAYTDDVLSLDSNVLLMDLCSAFVYSSNKVLALENEISELKEIVSNLEKEVEDLKDVVSALINKNKTSDN